VVPKTAYEFEKNYRRIRGEPLELARYLQAIPVAKYRNLLATALDGDFLGDVVNALFTRFAARDGLQQEWVVQALKGISAVDRFKMSAMFLSEQHKEEITTMLNAFEGPDSDAVAKAYGVTL